MSVLIGNADSDQKREEAFISLMQMENVAGLIIAPTREDSPALAAASHLGLPVVVIDRRMSNIEVDTVLADNFKGSLLAIQHLIQLGHKRIGVVSGPLHLTSARERYTGYLQAMSDAGLAVETCRRQQRPVFDFLRQALAAYRARQPAPLLLPAQHPGP
jgi:DNA-binding LacI/PurR family transcriptional regulator